MNVEFVDHKSYLSLGICYVCSTLIILTGHPNIRNFFNLYFYCLITVDVLEL